MSPSDSMPPQGDDQAPAVPSVIPAAAAGTAAPLYDASYYAQGCGEPYEHNAAWLGVFDNIAGRIVSELRPRSVLDAGCALGFLVETLRQRGVQAWGIDVSRYAIEHAAPEVQPFLQISSILDPFPLPRYDLVVCIEVLEHLPPEQALPAVENLTRAADDIIFSSTPFDLREPTHQNVQPPEYWAGLFYRCGFIHDVDYDAAYISPWAMRFRKAQPPLEALLSTYERKLWLLKQETVARRGLSIETKLELMQKESRRMHTAAQLADTKGELQAVLNSRSWRLITRLQQVRQRLIPPGSRREVVLHSVLHGLFMLKNQGLGAFLRRLLQKIAWQVRVAFSGLRFRLRPRGASSLIDVPEITTNPPASLHQAGVDVIICVHNAPQDVRRCLASVLEHSSPPYNLILVDDGSQAETCDLLAEFARQHPCQLLRNETAKGYTLAANQGLRLSSAEFALLLNSDTIVTPGWLDKLVACAQSDPRIGIVGPLSNCASWQSIPEIVAGGDWADNPLPPHIPVAQMGDWVAAHSARLYPPMQFLNGFCLLIKRQVIEQVGYFDEEKFGVGYGEENDYCLRARKSGWALALADDAYVYHAQSRSYNPERRKQLSERANRVLAEKHGQEIIDRGTADCRENRLLLGIRAHSQHLIEREELVQKAAARFSGRRVVFVLPVWVAGGGSTLVILAAQALRRMGVEASILNLHVHRVSFERAYPRLDVPVVYGNIEDVPTLVARSDAAIATFNPTVAWIAPALSKRPELKVGYYIQDYEPYFYTPGTDGYQTAFDSYTLIPGLVRVVTTQWIYDQVQQHHRPAAERDLPCTVIGASLDTALFWPRPRRGPEWPDRPLRIAAMIRPSSERRSPHLTMEVLQKVSQKYGAQVEFKLFGTKPSEPGFASLPQNFPWQLAGELSQRQVASLLNDADIFVDFSTFQGLGLTAMEAMSCGCAVIVPGQGGTGTFAHHEENCLVVDTSSSQACYKALQRLLEDHLLRTRLQSSAISAAMQFHPELPAYRLLKALFPEAA